MAKSQSILGRKRDSSKIRPSGEGPVDVSQKGYQLRNPMADQKLYPNGFGNAGDEAIFQHGGTVQVLDTKVVNGKKMYLVEGGPIKAQDGIVASIKKFFGFNQDEKPKQKVQPFPEYVDIQDTRKIHPVTGKPINPNVDLKSGRYSAKVVKDIVDAANKLQYQYPYRGIATGLQETNLGKIDKNLGHVRSAIPQMDLADAGYSESEIDSIMDVNPNYASAISMISNLKNKQAEAIKKGYKTPEYQLQFYNGMGKLTPATEKAYHDKTGRSTKQFYGVDVTKEPLDLAKNPAYGKTVMSLIPILEQNPEIQRIVKGKEKGGKIKAQKGVVAESTGVNKIIPEQQFVTNKQALQQLFAQQQAIQKNSTVKKTKEQGKIAKAWDVASHPATAIRALNTQGYIPQNLGKGETAPLDYAFDIVNPSFYANAIGRTAKNIVTPQTYTDIPKTLGYLLQKASGEHISPDLQQAAYSTLGKAMDASIAIPVFGEIAGDLKNLNVYKHLPEDATISTMGISNEGNPYIHNKKQILIKDLESDINEKLLKGYGINKKGTNLSVKLQRTPKISAEGTDFEFIVKENNKKIGTIGLNKKSGGIEGGKVGTYYEKDADYPYAWADEESYKGSGVSGEINKAITDVLQESKLGHLYSSGSHTPEGLKRWKDLVRKGKAEKIGKETYRLLEKGGTIKVLKEKTVNGKKHYLIDTKD